jgi:hypothetical protein
VGCVDMCIIDDPGSHVDILDVQYLVVLHLHHSVPLKDRFIAFGLSRIASLMHSNVGLIC